MHITMRCMFRPLLIPPAVPVTCQRYRGYRSLAPLLLKYLDPALPLLQVGVGTSTLQLDMVEQVGSSRRISVTMAGGPLFKSLLGNACGKAPYIFEAVPC